MMHYGKDEISRAILTAVRCPLVGLVMAGVMTSCGLAVAWTADVVASRGFASAGSAARMSVGPSLPRPLRIHLTVVGADPEMQARIEQAVRGSGLVRIMRDGPADYSLQIHFIAHLDVNGRERAWSWSFAAVRFVGSDRLAFHGVYTGERAEAQAKCRLGVAAFSRAVRGR